LRRGAQLPAPAAIADAILACMLAKIEGDVSSASMN
jgi:hypothetical protein